MSSPLIKKPFINKSFYLDLKVHPNQEELIKDLKKLGGKVESFLSKDVTHVLTDRKEFSKRESLASDGTIKNTPSRSSSKMYTSPLGYFNSPAYSPVNDYGRVRSPVTSRGLALVQKAQQKREGTTDIFEVCTQWNIKVVHIEVVSSLIYQYKVDYTRRMNLFKEQQKANEDAENVPYKFTLPFIKVEDANMQYKPAYKEFKTWKNMVDPDLHSAFSTVMQDIGLNSCPSSATTFENGSTGVLREFNADLRLKNSINFKIHSLKPEEESLRTMKWMKIDQVNHDTKETLSISYNDERRKARSSISLRNPKDKPVKKLKKRYCEICRHSYVDIDEHLLTQVHKKYLGNPNNFRKVEEIIQTMPSASQFLNKWKNREMEAPVSRDTSLPGWLSQFENSEELGNDKDSEKASVLPIPQWQTVGNCFGDAEHIGLYSSVNHEYYNNMLSRFPLTNISYVSYEKANNNSMYGDEKSLFNISPSLSVPCVGDSYPERKEFSDHAINLCTRKPEHEPKEAYDTQSATELYNYDSDDLVGASCSTAEFSSRLPYLEDSIEKSLPSKGTICIDKTSLVKECTMPFTYSPKNNGRQSKLFAVL